MIQDTSPMIERYYTNEDTEISCEVCGKKLGIAHRRFKNMKFENGTYKHLLKSEAFEGSEEVCKINDNKFEKTFYLCKEHFEKVFELKEFNNSFPEIIEKLKQEDKDIRKISMPEGGVPLAGWELNKK